MNRYPDHVAWADSIAEQANNRMTDSFPRQALYYLDSVYLAAPDLGIADYWRKYNVEVNYYSNYDRNLEQRSRCIDSMFGVLKGNENRYAFEYSHTLFEKAGLARAQRQYEQAFQFYYDGRNFAQQHLDSCSMIDFSNSLGVICYQQGQYMKAVPYLRQAFIEATSCRPDAGFYYGFILPQAVLNTMGICYEKAGRMDSALSSYQEALDCINTRALRYPKKQDFVNSARGVVEGNLGGTFALLNRNKEAELHLKNSIFINDHPGFAIEDAQTAKIKLANLYSREGRMSEADSLLEQVYSDLVSGRGRGDANNEVWQEYYFLKWHIYEQANNLSDAYRYMQRYYAYNDSVDRVNKGLKTTDIDRSLKEREQQFKLALLQKDDEVKTAYLIAVIVFLVLASCIAFFVWNNLRRSKRNVLKLTGLNKRLRDTLAALKQSQADNTRMMKIAAHDLRSPISGMISVASILMGESDRTEKDRTLLQMLKQSGENSLSLVNSLLQVNTRVVEQEKEPVDLQDLLRYCVDLLKHKADSKHQKIELHARSVTLRVSNEKMWRVMSNLIGNAIKFSPVGSVIVIGLNQVDKEVLITVEDKGIGIPDEWKDKIFDIFTDARRKGTDGEESHGLGLAVSRQIVEAHGGRIWLDSEQGKGTTFYVALQSDVK